MLVNQYWKRSYCQNPWLQVGGLPCCWWIFHHGLGSSCSRFLFGFFPFFKLVRRCQFITNSALTSVEYYSRIGLYEFPWHSRLFSGNAERMFGWFFHARRQGKWRQMGDLLLNWKCDLFSCNFICTFQWKPACPSTFTRNAYIRLPLESGTSIFLA